jgi:protein involved in polysaccharide export with SLBB domain
VWGNCTGASDNIVFAYMLVFYLLCVTGCGPTLSSPEHVREFDKAGPIRVEEDIDVAGADAIESHPGPYRVIRGDILELQMPAVLRVISSDLYDWLQPTRYGHKDIEPYLARVSQAGTITLPIVGEIPVAGRTLAEIEVLVIDAYFPKYVVNPPLVVCQMAKYQSTSERIFTVMGLVNKSGAYSYPPDVKYNLMEALGFAGGLDMVADPRYVKIYRQDDTGKIVTATFGVSGKSLDKAYNILIKPGDLIYVDHTLRTRTNVFLSDVFRITVNAGTNYSYND